MWFIFDYIKFANLIGQMSGLQNSRRCPAETRESQNHFRFFWRERFDVHPPMHYFGTDFTLNLKDQAHFNCINWQTVLQKLLTLEWHPKNYPAVIIQTHLMGQAVQVANTMMMTQSWPMLLWLILRSHYKPWNTSITHMDFTFSFTWSSSNPGWIHLYFSPIMSWSLGLNLMSYLVHLRPGWLHLHTYLVQARPKITISSFAWPRQDLATMASLSPNQKTISMPMPVYPRWEDYTYCPASYFIWAIELWQLWLLQPDLHSTSGILTPSELKGLEI